MAVETLSFTTPARKRVQQPVPVVFCGEELELQRPKDAVLYFAGIAAGDAVGDADRALALVQFVNAVFDPGGRKRFFERILDPADPVHLQETLELVSGVLDRWNNWPAKGKPEPVVVTPGRHDPVGEPVVVQHRELGLSFTAHPPKDIVSLFAAAALAVGSNQGQEAWAVGLFLDAALDPQDGLVVSHRMRAPRDDLDIEHVAAIVEQLAQRWAPTAQNRAARRTAARTGRTTPVRPVRARS